MNKAKTKKQGKRTHRLTIRFAEIEYESVLMSAKMLGCLPAVYVRNCALGKRMEIKNYITAELPELREQVAKAQTISDDLNQLAIYLHNGGTISKSILNEILCNVQKTRELRQEISRIREKYHIGKAIPTSYLRMHPMMPCISAAHFLE